jgi:hypothetical protein
LSSPITVPAISAPVATGRKSVRPARAGVKRSRRGEHVAQELTPLRDRPGQQLPPMRDRVLHLRLDGRTVHLNLMHRLGRPEVGPHRVAFRLPLGQHRRQGRERPALLDGGGEMADLRFDRPQRAPQVLHAALDVAGHQLREHRVENRADDRGTQHVPPSAFKTASSTRSSEDHVVGAHRAPALGVTETAINESPRAASAKTSRTTAASSSWTSGTTWERSGRASLSVPLCTLRLR